MKNNTLFLFSCMGIFFLCNLIIYTKNTTIQVEKSTIWKSDRYTLPQSYTGGLLPKLSHESMALVSATKQLHNNAPVVKILIPENNARFEWNSLIRYAISVSDEEDGKSEYQEIASNEVFLEVLYVSDTAKVATYFFNDTTNNRDPAGLAIIKSSDCFNCHAVKNKLQGPAFSEIAKRYPQNFTTVETLVQRVIKGNSGVWGNVVMPPHPTITEMQARQIIQWILENANNPDRDYYVGLEGTFRTKVKPENDKGGMYILNASYGDHGLKDQPQLSLRGQHTRVLYHK